MRLPHFIRHWNKYTTWKFVDDEFSRGSYTMVCECGQLPIHERISRWINKKLPWLDEIE